MDTLTLLREIGLNEKEARVYLAALKLGPTGVQRLALNADLKRPTVYNVVAALARKGLMREEVRGFKRRLVAEHPDRLREILATRTATLEQGLPALLGLYAFEGEESVIKVYEGVQGVRRVYEDVLRELRPGDDYLIVADSERWFETDRAWLEDFQERREKKRANIRMLVADTPGARREQEFAENFGMRIKVFPPGPRIETNLVMVPRRLVVHQVVPPIQAMVIENLPAVRTFKLMFELLWAAIP